jgi:hypothetical protein
MVMVWLRPTLGFALLRLPFRLGHRRGFSVDGDLGRQLDREPGRGKASSVHGQPALICT